MGKLIFQYQSQSHIYYTMPAECRNVTLERLYVGEECPVLQTYTSVNKNPTGEDHQNQQYLSINTPTAQRSV